ncbi:hypothetical protein B6D60_01145 [candidate division KSB1 bacterium 4484_87]|nr:MAG: hypothetical protein B6D60_01145 [candidate division KSB1 bacterium 4484_87]
MCRYIIKFGAIVVISIVLFLSCGDNDNVVGSKTDSIETLTTSEPAILADGLSSAIIVATVLDSSGKHAGGLPVHFETTFGTINETVYTDQDGNAYALLQSVASATDIKATVTATVLDTLFTIPKTRAHFGVNLSVKGMKSLPGRKFDLKKSSAAGENSASIDVTFLGITFSGELQEIAIPADGISKSRLKVNIKETTSKKAITEAQISLAACYGTIVNKIVTDNQGLAQTDITAATTEVTDSIFMEYGNVFRDTLFISYEKPNISISPKTVYLIADGSSKTTFTVSLKSKENTPIVNAEVRFSATNGTIAPSSVFTNSEGIAQATLTSVAKVDTNVLVIARLNSFADTSHANFIKPILSLTPETGELPADGNSEMDFTASLLLPDHTPVVGAVINFSTSAGSITPASGETDATGSVSATLKSSFDEKENVIVKAAFQELEETATVKFSLPVLTISPTEAKLLANGSSKQTFTAALISRNNVPIENAEIVFSTTNGTISNSTAITNAEGKATTDLRSSTIADSNVKVIAQFHHAADTAAVVFIPSSTESGLMLDGEKELFRDGISSTSITATVLDDNGNPVSDATVFFTAQYGTIPQTAITGTDGKATVTYTADVGENSISDEITATVGTASVSHAINLIGLTMTLTASPDSIPADGTSKSVISVHLKQTESQLAVPGISITFTSNLGFIGTTATTDNEGVAIIELRAASTPGKATVTATYGQFVKTVDVQFYLNSPQSMVLTADPNYIWVKETGNLEQTVITATVLGVQGHPIGHSVPIKFYVQNSPDESLPADQQCGFVDEAGTVVRETASIYTSDGSASIGFRSGTKSGTVEIRAELVDQPQTLSRQAVIVIRSGPPYIWIDPADPNHVLPNMTLYLDYFNQDGKHALREYNVTALLGDKYNNPVEQNTTVYFTTTGGVITTDTKTDAQGFAHVSLFSGNPFPTTCPSDTRLDPHQIPNPNADGLFLPITLTDFEGGEVVNSCGDTGENDGIAVIYAYTWGRDQNGNDATVFSTAKAIFGGAIAHFEVFVDPPVDSLNPGEVANIHIRVWDEHGNPPSAGSSLTASTSAGKLSVEKFMPDKDRYGYGSTYFTTSLLNNLDPVEDEAQMAEVTIELDAPNPNGKVSGTVYVYLKL